MWAELLSGTEEQRRALLRSSVLLMLVILSISTGLEARKAQPDGLLALSAGDEVVLADVRGGGVNAIETGPVGFLFPAPGGIIFAPDLIHGRTSVIDVRRGRQREVLNFLNMPRFTIWKDRYLVLAGDLLMLSYPDRSVIFRMNSEITKPWQIYSSEDGMSLLILERSPDGKGPSVLTALDLGVRKQVFRKSFPSDYVRFVEMEDPGVLVLADRSGKQILVLEPQTLVPLKEIPLEEAPTDIISIGNVLYEAGDAGRIRRWKMERSRQGELKLSELDEILTGAMVLKMAVSPDTLFFAAASDQGKLRVYGSKKARLIREIDIPSRIRDLVWVDPFQEGPILPLWSDQDHEMPKDLRPPALKQ